MSKPFTFIACKGFRGIRDRGGLQFLFKAFYDEFDKDENVELMVKINPAYPIPDIMKELAKIGLKEPKAPIRFVTDNIAYKAMVKFYHHGDVFVTTSQAESFNLPCIEAMACGIPVIATTFGGQSDFVNEENGWLLKDGKMKEVKWDIMYEGVSWKEPSVKEIREKLRYAFENKKEVEDKGIVSHIHSSMNWTWKDSADKAKEALEEIDVSN